MTTLFGPCIEGSVSLDERLIAAYAEIYGPNRCARLAIPWDKETNPSPGVFNLGMYVENLRKLKAHGYVTLLGNNWAPAWASEGQPTYVEYFHGCSLMDGMTFAGDREWCSNPRHIDPLAKYNWSAELAKQLGPYVDYASDWNEPGGWVFWPPMSLGQDVGLRRLVKESYVPFVRAFRIHAPNVQLIGYEAQGADEIWRLRELEAEHSFRAATFNDRSRFLFPDGVAYHYPLNREVEYENWGFNQPTEDTRPRFVTEAGYADLNLTLQELRQTMARPVKPKMFIWYQNIGQNITMVDPVTFRPNSFGEAIKAEIAKYNSGPKNDRASNEQVDAAFRDLWEFGKQHAHGFANIETATPGAVMCKLAASIHDGANVPPSMDLMKKLAERIDARFKQPLLGEVKVLNDA